MNRALQIALVMAVIVGVIAYFQSGSWIPIVAGSASAFIVVFGLGYLLTRKKPPA